MTLASAPLGRASVLLHRTLSHQTPFCFSDDHLTIWANTGAQQNIGTTIFGTKASPTGNIFNRITGAQFGNGFTPLNCSTAAVVLVKGRGCHWRFTTRATNGSAASVWMT